MKFIWLQLVVWMLCTSLQCGAVQLCDLTNNLTTGITSFIPIDVNLTQTSCFRCPKTAASFTINDQTIASGSGVNITSTTLMISNWSAYVVSRTATNMLSCKLNDGPPPTTLFFTLTPGPLTLRQPVPTFFLENNSSNISILCVNNNRRPAYTGQIQVWTDSTGTVVGNGRTLVLPQVRASAGTYTCDISSIPIIPVVTYDVVIYFAPEIHTNYLSSRTIAPGETLRLNCSYLGIPQPNVIWTMNNSQINSSTNLNISITNMISEFSMTTVLTWTSVPVDAQGTYKCMANNNVGSTSASVTINIAKQNDFPSSEGTSSTTMNPKGTISTSNSTYIIIIAIIVALVVIIVIFIIFAVLFLLFKRKFKKENLSNTTTSTKAKSIPVNPQSSQQDSIGLYAMINTSTLRQSPDAEDVDSFDLYDQLESKIKTSDKQTSATYSMIEKEAIGQNFDDEIPDLYSVVNNNNGKKTVNNCIEVSELYTMVDKTRRNTKGNDNTMDLYAVVDKSKKKEQKLEELDPDISEMYAVVNKTRKNKEERDEDKDFNISDMYAVVDKSKKTDNKQKEETPDLLKMSSVVKKRKYESEK